MKRLAAFLLLALGAAPQETPPAPDRDGVEFFEKKIRPVLADRCYSCHSAGAAKLKGELYVDSREGLLKGGETGPAVVPGDPEKSLIIKAIRYADDLKMPPKGRLSKEVVEDFVAWVKRGAPDPRGKAAGAAKKGINIEAGRAYWAFQPLHPPAGATIDTLLGARLEAAGVRPNGPAERRTLIRRATFDLLGLPPTPAEVDAFLADASPDAYEKLIDRLLARPEYGERWARHWLDIARFAESHGFEQDYDRENAYHYRDFLIKAFNADLPYDRFVQWQIAGDELAPAEPLAWMATGFLGAGAFPTQLTEAEFESARYDELDSMTATTSSAFLGLSLGCARCHDHKFDPLPSRDYYRMASTFTTAIRAMAELEMDPEGDRAALAKWKVDHDAMTNDLAKFEKEELPARFDHWAAGRPWEKQASLVWTVLDFFETTSQGGAMMLSQADGSVLVSGENPKNDKWTFKAKTTLQGLTAVRLEALQDPSLKKNGPGRADNGNFSLSEFRLTLRPLGGGPAVPVKLSAGNVSFEQNKTTLSAASSVGAEKGGGWAVDPQFGKDHAAVFEFAAPVGFPGGTELTFEFAYNNNVRHAIGRPRLSVTSTPLPAPLGGESKPQALVELCDRLRDGGALDAPARERAIALYARIDDEAVQRRRALIRHFGARPEPKKTKVLVTTEGLKPLKHHADDRGFPHFYKETFVLARGDVNKKQEVATQGFVQVLERGADETRWIAPPAPGSRTPGRRASLARWLTDVEAGAGPLLARVIVNRLWAQHFGRGIVATTNDFGVQGEPPTHPEILDALAADLIRGGWRLKAIHKAILTSAAYRRSADLVPASAAKDPDNRLYWRRDPRRLEAEAIRDSLLDVGGLLDRTMYGPGTLDEGMTRRSVYFFIKRSRLIPMMMVFDAPEPLASQGNRPTTTIAPQALLFMNSPLVRRCAAGLAKQGDVASIYRRALGRAPTERELAKASAFLSSQEKSYREAGKADPALAARVDFCQAILCMNEFIYVD